MTTLPARTQRMRSREEIRSEFERQGLTVKCWALHHGFEPSEVYAMLAGRTRGRRGRAHDLAVALGLKADPAGREEALPDHLTPEDAT